MKLIPVYFLLLFQITITVPNTIAQNNLIDSLERVINNGVNNCPKPCLSDTNKINALNELSIEYIKKGDYENGKKMALLAIDKSNEITYKKGIGEALNCIGTTFHYQGDLDEALGYYLKSLKIREENGDKKGIASSFNNIALIHRNQGRYEQAIEYNLKSIQIKEALEDKEGMAASYNNISIIYKKQGLLELAIEFSMKSLAICEETGNQKGVAGTYNNIGLLFHGQKNSEQALEYYMKSLNIYESIKDFKNVSKTLNNIGLTYIDKGEFEMAMEYYNKGLIIEEKAGNKKDIASFYTNIGACYIRYYKNYSALFLDKPENKTFSKNDILDSAKFYQLKAYEMHKSIGDRVSLIYNHTGLGNVYLLENKPLKALNHFLEAKVIADEINSKTEILEVSGHLVDAYKELGRYKEALEYFELFKSLSDTLLNTETQKSINRHEAKYEYDKMKMKDSLQHSEQVSINEIKHQEEIKKQEVYTFAGALGFSFMLVLALVLFRSYRSKQKSNSLITSQKEEIEHRHKEITDSINYAKRIQEALLKETEHVSKALPSHFILYKPKDVISGDFYWSLEKKESLYIAVADCTGHGVPGAMMSMLGIAFLNEITSSEKLLSPASILDKLREKIVKELKQSGKEGENKDGMDISIVCLNLLTHELQWAGANNPIWIINEKPAELNSEGSIINNNSNTELREIKPNKQPIGYHPGYIPFTNNVIKLKKNSSFYLITDGFHDQFGGDKGKKFKPSQLKDLLLKIHSKSMEDQKEKLNKVFEDWKGELEQVDDICIIGMRI
ncbi:MAG: tetratricopeptide repeat protein [Bacteroidetes bacterium]|nr:tetratricopeptide repeat protein [Bacteroidota bacterium]HET6243442.1 tetratricopeptide repeat protein [Bacteroidia bacterium]